LESFNLLKGSAGDPLKIAVHPCRRLDDAPDLPFSFRPKARHGLALAVEVRLHFRELFNDGFDAMSETSPRQILIHHLHLGLLALPCNPGFGDGNQGFTQGHGDSYGAPRLRNPHSINQVEGIRALWQCLGDNQSNVRLGGTLIIAAALQASVAPVLGALRLLKDGAAALPGGVCHVLDNVPAKLAFRNSLDLIEWKLLIQQPFKF
jgi:hypothetical protein